MGKSCLAFFLGGIKDPDFEMKLEIQKKKYDHTLIHYVIAIQKTREGDHKESFYI